MSVLHKQLQANDIGQWFTDTLIKNLSCQPHQQQTLQGFQVQCAKQLRGVPALIHSCFVPPYIRAYIYKDMSHVAHADMTETKDRCHVHTHGAYMSAGTHESCGSMLPAVTDAGAVISMDDTTRSLGVRVSGGRSTAATSTGFCLFLHTLSRMC